MGIKDGKFFEKAARKAYKEIDVDGEGKVDYKEVCIGILKIYDNLNMKFPAHVPAPKRDDVMTMCAKYDTDGNGTIEFEEFLEMAKVLVGSRKNFFESIPWLYGSVLCLKLVICPILASYVIKGFIMYVHEGYGKKIPQGPVAAVLEIIIKLLTK